MKKFKHINARTLDEAVSLLGTYKRKMEIIAGGTDLLGVLKSEILPTYPEAIINIKTIPKLDYIREEDGALKIGALTTLSEIAESSLVKDKYTALAEAAGRVASPHIRWMGTIGGNICQGIRCWYYRYPHHLGGKLICRRKGGSMCYAAVGDNRYHSIFGAVSGCIAVNPSDTAPALVALDAKVKTSKRTINAEEFFTVNGPKTTVLDDDEIVTEIQVPVPDAGTESAFIKFALRESIDFPIINCAAAITCAGGTVKAAKICLNAVYNNPYRATVAEEAIVGKSIDETNAEAAGSAAISGAKATQNNKDKVQIAKTLVKRVTLLISNSF